MFIAFFGLFAIVCSLFATIAGVASKESHGRWWLIAFSGAVWGLIGILTAIWPGLPRYVVLVLIAGWAVITGGVEIAATIKLRKFITLEWLMIATGILSMFFVWLLIVFRGPGTLNVVGLVGVYAVALGILQVVLSLKLREIRKPL